MERNSLPDAEELIPVAPVGVIMFLCLRVNLKVKGIELLGYLYLPPISSVFVEHNVPPTGPGNCV